MRLSCASMAHFSSLNLLRCIYIRWRGEWCNVCPFTKQTASWIKQKSTERRSRNLAAARLCLMSSAQCAWRWEDGGWRGRFIKSLALEPLHPLSTPVQIGQFRHEINGWVGGRTSKPHHYQPAASSTTGDSHPSPGHTLNNKSSVIHDLNTPKSKHCLEGVNAKTATECVSDSDQTRFFMRSIITVIYKLGWSARIGSGETASERIQALFAPL